MADLICSTEALPDFVAKDCGGDEAGIVAVAFIDNSVALTPSTIVLEETWETLLAATPQLVQIIKETRGEYGKPSVTESEGFGRVSTVVTGRDHELTFEVLGIEDNVDFFDQANARKDLRIAFVTNGGLLHYVDKPISVDAGMVIDRDIKAWEYFSVTVKWNSFLLPKVYPEPGEIFK